MNQLRFFAGVLRYQPLDCAIFSFTIDQRYRRTDVAVRLQIDPK